ncbi:hypothetical protein GCM10023321_49200 [Pseudonocardia eucalypti]|uniref:Uncharacterized protein n=1 Tax=Pseudonocardia eucalypti TaxID=648755 RepID=A0ABP9QJQ2_9PSEU|nr:1-aminocyclopropane-1-carboxylate deaminase/D-cysteine desulfhydrase-like pyridoxal-dependent ACC family enzyme [Pseudonocardia eucalypti]
MDAMRSAARTEGTITDPVHEGKSMAGLIDLVRCGEISKDSTVLSAHLGGQPALNGNSGPVQLMFRYEGVSRRPLGSGAKQPPTH